ncbi:hypothetical protein [Hymenobacter nivis]|uniref:Uncharacterized protein n=1 Tax=Hymenobacter nivis TaxID=1850093 RepID=A0A502H045_9BACT|nr:hypothetical protein [Hymenobacter nivis]TPG66673.1 hypothetical protein EAH73_09805 [Hymenobacter nivis]
MRFGWISAFVPDARGVRWIFGLLLLPAVWLAKGGNAPAPPPAPVAAVAPAAAPAAPAPLGALQAPAAPRSAR